MNFPDLRPAGLKNFDLSAKFAKNQGFMIGHDPQKTKALMEPEPSPQNRVFQLLANSLANQRKDQRPKD